MPLAHPGLQSSKAPLVPWHGQRKFSANWSRVLVFGASLFVTVNSPRAQDTGALSAGKSNPPTQTRQKSRFNGIMSARSTNPAHLFVVERAEEEDQTT